MIQTTKFARKAFYVDAVQVTSENMAEVAQWCMGELKNDDPRAADNPDAAPQYIKVRVHRAISLRQTKAFPGDWVLYATTGFKVYTPAAFENSFDRVTTLTKEQADEADIHPPIENRPKPAPPKTALSDEQKEYAEKFEQINTQ